MQEQYKTTDSNGLAFSESLSVEQMMFDSSLELLENEIFKEYDDMFERLSK